jgi:Tfp pilus assembly protein PilF
MTSGPTTKRDRNAASKATPRQLLGVTDREFEAMGKLGTMYYEQGDLERARIVFEGMVEADPLSSSAHAALGALYLRTGHDEVAIPHLNHAIELDSTQLSAYVNRAEVELKLKQPEKAVADLKRAIELDPTGQNPAANRARMMALGLHQALKAKNLGN